VTETDSTEAEAYTETHGSHRHADCGGRRYDQRHSSVLIASSFAIDLEKLPHANRITTGFLGVMGGALWLALFRVPTRQRQSTGRA